MADEIEKRSIEISVDKQTSSAALKSIQGLDKAVADLGNEAKALDKALSGNAASVKKVSSANKEASQSIKTVDSAIDGQTQSVKQATNAIAEYEASLRAVKSGGADLSGDIAGSLGGLRGAASAVGLGGVTDIPLGIAEAAADFGEFLPKLKVGLEAASKSGSGVVSTVASLAASALPAAGASFGAIAVALAPIAIAGAAVVGALALVSSELDKAQQAALRQAEAQRAASQATNELIANGATTGEALSQLTTAGYNEVEQATLDLRDAQEAYANYVEQRGANIFQGLGDAVGLFGDVEQSLADDVKESETAFINATTAYTDLNNSIQAGEFAANDTAAAEVNLAKTREEMAIEAARIAEQSAIRDAQLNSQRESLLENRAIAESNAEESAALERKFARQDEKAEAVKQKNELAAISRDGAAKVAEIAKEIADLPNALNKELAEAQAKGDKALGKLQSDYYSNSIKAVTDFNKDAERIEKDTAKATLRLREDLLDNLNKAVQNNDVIAFLNAQEEGQQQLARSAEDASDSEKQRAEDFKATQNEQRQAFQERQAEILAGISEERAKITESYMQRRTELEAQRQQEILNTQQAITNAQARFASEEAAKNQALERDKARQAIKDRQEQAAFERQVAAINAQLSGAQQVESAFSNAIARIVASANNAAGSKSASGAPGGKGRGNNIKGRGSFGRNNSNTSSSNTYNINVGDIATGSQVKEAINQTKKDIYGSIGNAMQGAK